LFSMSQHTDSTKAFFTLIKVRTLSGMAQTYFHAHTHENYAFRAQIFMKLKGLRELCANILYQISTKSVNVESVDKISFNLTRKTQLSLSLLLRNSLSFKVLFLIFVYRIYNVENTSKFSFMPLKCIAELLLQSPRHF
jgi:hypothetical protein